MNWITTAVIVVLLLGIIIYVILSNCLPDKQSKKEASATYYARPHYISSCEQHYFDIFKKILSGSSYVVFPQIPLSQIVNVISTDIKYQYELNQVIDFGIFDATTFKPVLCIEINDKTHEQPDRLARDIKVKNILTLADLPLLTFWPKNGINEASIEEGIKFYLDL